MGYAHQGAILTAFMVGEAHPTYPPHLEFMSPQEKQGDIHSCILASSGKAAIDSIFQLFKKMAKPRLIVHGIFPAFELVQAQLQVLGELLRDIVK